MNVFTIGLIKSLAIVAILWILSYYQVKAIRSGVTVSRSVKNFWVLAWFSTSISAALLAIWLILSFHPITALAN